MTSYHYTECGLDNVYVVGFDPVVDDEGELVHKVSKINLLHRVIALEIVLHEHGMSGKELRFLRTEMGMTQAELANRLHREALSIGRWERGETPMSSNAEALIRLIAIEKLDLHPDLTVEEMTLRCVPTAEPQLITIDGADPDNYQPVAA